jgi:hypothetical protein
MASGEMMLRVVSKGLWPTLAAKARRAAVKRAAIAYVGTNPPIRFGKGDTLIVDASDASIKAGRTSARALQSFLKQGAALYNRGDLHAKVMLLDDWAIVGSANASGSRYTEAAIITDRTDVAGQVERFITALCVPGSRLERHAIQRLLKLPVSKRGGRPRANAKHRSPAIDQPKTWLVSLRGDANYRGNSDKIDEISEEESRKAGKAGEADWFWTGQASFPDARPGDHFVEVWRPRTQIATTRSVLVFPPARLLRVYRERGAPEKTFHLLCPPSWEKRALSWTRFAALAKHAGITRAITYRSTVRLSDPQSSALMELWLS